MDSTCTAEYPLKHPPCGPPANPADRNVVDRQGGVFPPVMSLPGAMVNPIWLCHGTPRMVPILEASRGKDRHISFTFRLGLRYID